MSTLRTAGFGTAIVLAAVIGGTIIGSVAASSVPSAEPATSTAAEVPIPVPDAAVSGGAMSAETAGKYCQAFLESYAAALGVDASALAPAAEKAAESTIAAAVTAGDLIQAQADRLIARLKDAQPGGCPRFADRFGKARPSVGGVKGAAAAAASALGLTVDELRAQLKDGKSLKDVAAAQGVPYATVSAAVLAPVRTRLDAAVAAGTISRARADRILARLEANLADGRLRKGPAPAGSATPGG